MSYELEFTKLFVAQFERLEKEDQRRVYRSVQKLKESPYRYKRLTDPFRGCFRLRVGNFRVIYMPMEHAKKVVLIDVDVRKRVYKKDISKIIDQISERTPFQK